MLSEAAVRAARQRVFTSAPANNRPVAAWVAVPFNFRLQQDAGSPAGSETQRLLGTPCGRQREPAGEAQAAFEASALASASAAGPTLTSRMAWVST
jgi:hypothetical protein